MKNTKIKGFSLAEVMIAMLVISIAMAAAIPTITKRNAGSDNIWRMGTKTVGSSVEEDANTLAFTGPNIMIGTSRLPLLSGISGYFKDEALAPNIAVAHPRFYPKNDKLILFKKIDSDADRFKSSHIGFYNDSHEYAGRLASDKYNLALGIGALQSLQPDYSEAVPQGAYNTAIGHYTLLTNVRGSYNTAFGYNALRGNVFGNYNNNIAIGDNALRGILGDNNIAIGSRAGANVTGSNNIIIGANAGGNASNDNIIIGAVATDETDYDIRRVMRGDYRPSNTYPVPTKEDNFIIGAVNLYSAQVMPPLIQGYTQTQRGGEVGCVDGICHAKGLIINADNFYINTKGEETNGKVTKHPQPIFVVRTTVEKNALDISRASVAPPCSGAPICIAPFSVTTASLYTNQEQHDGFHNAYNRKSTYPRFKSPDLGNKTGLYNNPIYDLYIGSVFATNAEFVQENGKDLTGHDHAFEYYTKRLIDVGKQETNDSLEMARLTGSMAEDGTNIKNIADASRPNVLINKKSLKIRTVKTAVNFLDEFKEKSGIWDRIRDTVDYNLKFLFTYSDTSENILKYASNCDTSGQKSDWESIKTCDPNYYKENGKDLLAGLCEGVWERRDDRNAFLQKYKECRDGSFPNGILYCAIKSLFSENDVLDSDKEDTSQAALEYAKDKCSGKVIGYLTCLAKEKKNYVPPAEPSDTTESDARLKNISGDNTAGLKEINKLQVYNYTYKADKAKTPHVGVVAQELMTVFPDAVKKGSDGYYRIRLEDMFYAMINSVKELSKKKDELNALTVDYIDTPLSELEKQNADIKAQNELLKQKNEEIEKRLSKIEIK